MTNDFTPRRNGEQNKTDSRPQRLTKEEYKAKKDAERSEVFGMLDTVTKEVMSLPESFEQFLTTQARLDRYSAANALLIFKQMPNATKLKDFEGWGEEGVNVKKGEKHLSILEPSEYTRQNGTTGISYNIKSVFDVSQTSGKQTPAVSLNQNPSTVLIAMLDTAPVNVENVDDFGFTNHVALYDNKTGTLLVKRNVNDCVALFQDVAIELAFAQLSVGSERYDRQNMSFDAVCVAKILCKKYGVPSERFMISDLPVQWRNMQPKDVRAELSKIRTAASEICSRVSDELYRKRQEQTQDRNHRSRGDAR